MISLSRNAAIVQDSWPSTFAALDVPPSTCSDPEAIIGDIQKGYVSGSSIALPLPTSRPLRSLGLEPSRAAQQPTRSTQYLTEQTTKQPCADQVKTLSNLHSGCCSPKSPSMLLSQPRMTQTSSYSTHPTATASEVPTASPQCSQSPSRFCFYSHSSI